MWNYLFANEDENSVYYGEQIFVQCNTKKEAIKILRNHDFNMETMEYLGRFDDDEAEEMGFDTL